MSTDLSVLFLGDSGVGKSSLCTVLAGQRFAHYLPTIGAEMLSVPNACNTENNLTLWDVGGSERFLSAVGSTTVFADVCVLVCESCNVKSFEHLGAWHDEYLQAGCSGVAPPAIIVVINKCDMQSQAVCALDVVSWCGKEIVDPLLWPNDIVGDAHFAPPYVEVSAKTRMNTDTLLGLIVARGLLRRKLQLSLLNSTLRSCINDADLASSRGTVRCVLAGEGVHDMSMLLGALSSNVDQLPVQLSIGQSSLVVWPLGAHSPLPTSVVCRGAHACILTQRIAAEFSLENVILQREVFLRNAGLREANSVAWILLGITSESPEVAVKTRSWCAHNNCGYFSVTHCAASVAIEQIWTEISMFIETHRREIIVMRTQVDDQLCHCPYQSSGCTWESRVSDLQLHSAACPYKPAKCRFEGCGAATLLGEREKHEHSCPKRPSTCHFCGAPCVSLFEHFRVCGKRAEFESSHGSCPLLNFGCPCRDVPRIEIPRHIDAEAGHHIALLASALESTRKDALELERRLHSELQAAVDSQKLREAALQDQLASCHDEIARQKSTIKDLKLELKMVWQEMGK